MHQSSISPASSSIRYDSIVKQRFDKMFSSVSPLVEPSFWHALAKKKIDDMKLDEKPFVVKAFFQASRNAGGHAFAFLNEDSLRDIGTTKPAHFYQYTATFPMDVYLVNLKSTFQKMDRKGILDDLVKKILSSIDDRSWLSNPSILLSSAMTIFGDLKKWNFTWVCAFPMPLNNTSIEIGEKKEFTQEITEFPNWVFVLDADGKPAPLTSATKDSEFVFIDPSGGALGWPAYFLSFAISKTFDVSQFTLIRLNHDPSEFQVTVKAPLPPDQKYAGWRLNNKKPYFTDVSESMDPEALFKAAANLNLRLMKWRMAPELDVDKLHEQKVLLFGCGTLGCNVARDLLGWGVRKFTLLDYGKVSYSNPPRQPLFCFQDCLNGGRLKAEAAAEELKRICPDCECVYKSVEIPMPGHSVGEKGIEKMKETVKELDQLIQEHDVSFLLTDTRESRWLPTVICNARGKLCISVALGFDTFSVVRSGSRNCGCYFCNDIVAPVDTMSDRTLDMQCTVTRPGIAPLASSIGVELWASIAQHSDGKDADGKTESILGDVPHQIRGFLHNWQVLPMTGSRFSCCVGCSDPIIAAYLKDGPEFVAKAVTDASYIEDVSGITAMKESMVDEDCEWIDVDD